jgi:hypothetical protein
MPMMSPKVWVIHAPPRAVPCETASEAYTLVKSGETVVLPEYQTAIRALIMLGADPERAVYLAEDARRQPQFQESYTPRPG